jgi:hypothetical protein
MLKTRKIFAASMALVLIFGVAAQAAPKSSFRGSGTFKVGSQVQPGVYVSAAKPSQSCYWARLSDTSGSFDSIIANEFSRGQQVVEILDTDAAIKVTRCQTFRKLGKLKALSQVPTDGTYVVGSQLAPGLYVANGKLNQSCYWARLSDFQGNVEGIIANENGKGQQIVEILATDVGFEVSRCANFKLVTSFKPLMEIPAEGIYAVGQQIAPGTYTSTSSSDSCYWERLSDFSGTFDGIIANDFAEGQQIVTIESTDVGFSTSGCGKWVLSQD